jgi:hypothetical protein
MTLPREGDLVLVLHTSTASDFDLSEYARQFPQ